MKRFISLLLAAMLLFSLCACDGGGSSGKDKDKDNGDDKVSAIAFEYDCDSAELYGEDALYFSYILNSAKITDGVDSDAAAAINKVLGAAYDDAAQYRDTLKEDAYSAYLEGYALSAFSYSYKLVVERCDEAVISVCVHESIYSGGAHGIFSQTTYNFDTKTGKLLSVDDLSDDADALTEHIASYIQSDYADSVTNNEPDLSQVPNLIENGQWYFTNEGMVVFAQLYEIASYAAGMPTFIVPYDELDGFVSKSVMPKDRTGEGEIVLSDKGDKVAEFAINPEGETFALAADGTVYDVKIYEALMSPYSGYLVLQGCVYYRNVMSDGEYVSVSRYIPDVYCNIVLIYTDAEGVEHSCGVAQSGEDGSVYLIYDPEISTY